MGGTNKWYCIMSTWSNCVDIQHFSIQLETKSLGLTSSWSCPFACTIHSIESSLVLQCFPLKKRQLGNSIWRDKDKIRSQKHNNKNKGSFVIRGLSRERETNRVMGRAWGLSLLKPVPSTNRFLCNHHWPKVHSPCHVFIS